MDSLLKSCTAGQKRIALLALTFIIVVVVVLMCPDLTTSLIIIGGLLGFCAAFVAAGPDGICPVKEGLNPLPGAPTPHAVAAAALPSPADASHYPGAIDADEYDTEAGYGHRDRTEGDNDDVPVGNPYNRSRVSYQPAAGACIDDEANDAEMDGDERSVYSALSRNDAERVTAGTMNRRRDLDKYFREELEEAENRMWWGRHES